MMVEDITFTDRQITILRDLYNGKTDGEIAAMHGWSIPSVRKQIEKLRLKTNSENRLQLGAFAERYFSRKDVA